MEKLACEAVVTEAFPTPQKCPELRCGGAALEHPCQGKPTSKAAFGEDFPVTIVFQTPPLPPHEDIVQQQPVFSLSVHTEPTHI